MANAQITDVGTEVTNPTRSTTYIETEDAGGTSGHGNLVNLIGNGYADYNDAATSGTPISPTTSTWTQLTNDGAGTYTNTSYLPAGVTALWDTSTDQFDFSELSLGDQVDIRFDLSITTTASNQVARQRVQFDIGGSPYTLEFDHKQVKTAGTYQIIKQVRFHMGNAGTISNPGQWQIWSDASSSVVVHGVYISVTRR